MLLKICKRNHTIFILFACMMVMLTVVITTHSFMIDSKKYGENSMTLESWNTQKKMFSGNLKEDPHG